MSLNQIPDFMLSDEAGSVKDKIAVLSGVGGMVEKTNKSEFDAYMAENAIELATKATQLSVNTIGSLVTNFQNALDLDPNKDVEVVALRTDENGATYQNASGRLSILENKFLSRSFDKITFLPKDLTQVFPSQTSATVKYLNLVTIPKNSYLSSVNAKITEIGTGLLEIGVGYFSGANFIVTTRKYIPVTAIGIISLPVDITTSSLDTHVYFSGAKVGYNSTIGAYRWADMVESGGVITFTPHYANMTFAIEYIFYTNKLLKTFSLSDSNLKNVVEIFNDVFTNLLSTYAYTSVTQGIGMVQLGTGSRMYRSNYLIFDTFRSKSIVSFTGSTAKFGIMHYNPYSSFGALFLVDTVTAKISMHKQFTGTTIPDMVAESEIPFTLAESRKYMAEVTRDGWTYTFRLTDTVTQNYAEVSFNNEPITVLADYVGRAHGAPGAICFAGTLQVYSMQYLSPIKHTKALFIGDSITEGDRVILVDKWCERIRKSKFNNDAIISGRGGAKADDVLRRLQQFYTDGFTADYVVVLVGTNDANANLMADWYTNIDLIHQLIIDNKGIPIICVPPVGVSNSANIQLMATYVTTTKTWQTIRFDIATTINYDGVTYMADNFADGNHPSLIGSGLMYEYGTNALNYIID